MDKSCHGEGCQLVEARHPDNINSASQFWSFAEACASRAHRCARQSLLCRPYGKRSGIRQRLSTTTLPKLHWTLSAQSRATYVSTTSLRKRGCVCIALLVHIRHAFVQMCRASGCWLLSYVASATCRSKGRLCLMRVAWSLSARSDRPRHIIRPRPLAAALVELTRGVTLDLPHSNCFVRAHASFVLTKRNTRFQMAPAARRDSVNVSGVTRV